MGMHWPELVVVVLIGLMFFGTKRLPEVGSSVGKTIREFQRSMREVTGSSEPPTTSALPRASSAPVPTAAPAATASAEAAPPAPTTTVDAEPGQESSQESAGVSQ
jgi:sec-independent protein translocase protein TatA